MVRFNIFLPHVTHVTSVNLTQRRFIVNKRDREGSENPSESNKKLKIENIENYENMENAVNSNFNENMENVVNYLINLENIENYENMENIVRSETETNPNNILEAENIEDFNLEHEENAIENALIIRNGLLTGNNNTTNGYEATEELRRIEDSISNMYTTVINNLPNQDSRESFDQGFIDMMIDTANSDLIEDYFGVNPDEFEREDESISEFQLDLEPELDLDNDDAEDDEGSKENVVEDQGNNTSNDNNSSDSDPSGGAGLSSNNIPTVEKLEENLSEGPDLNTKNSSVNNSEINYSDFFSFVLFHFLNAFSIIIEIMSEIFMS